MVGDKMTAYYCAIKTLLKHHVKELPVELDDIKAILKSEGWQLIPYTIGDAKKETVAREFRRI